MSLGSLPEGLLVAWYGDDFSGAAAVMEVFTFSGVPAMLFLDVPTLSQLANYPDLRAIGVASTARAWSPEQMAKKLPVAFASLLALKPELLHYKICSTLDSSPAVGSIGRAIEIGATLTNASAVPVLVAAPQMRRYQIFGHLFAGFGDEVYRLDRHPVMACHPVTPMKESDVAQHISAQSDLIDASLWSREDIASNRKLLRSGKIPVMTIDSLDAQSEVAAGRMIWEQRAKNPFIVGSQGVEYALVRHWAETNSLPNSKPPGGVGRAHGMVVVSGSVSPTTAKQIAWSRNNGFATIRFDVSTACSENMMLTDEKTRVIKESLVAISAGIDPLICTAEGYDGAGAAQFKRAVETSGKTLAVVNKRIGQALGDILSSILDQSGIRRAVISGGDTSGYATQRLGIFGLSALAPTIPGASLFLAHADGPMDGLELALKGGQMGSPDYFGWIRDGGGIR
jgi:uncharacterized protein YgbK (DUF1537 family)